MLRYIQRPLFAILPLLLLSEFSVAFLPRQILETTQNHGGRCFASIAPPPPEFTPKPLPMILGGGLFLFGSSVKRQDRDFADRLLAKAGEILRTDPIVTMELGQGIETGGVYASKRTTSLKGIDQMVLQFQIQGGNAWAQGVAYGIKAATGVELVSLEVANMDASMRGTPINVAIPSPLSNYDEIKDR
jgi:hypothetical protein